MANLTPEMDAWLNRVAAAIGIQPDGDGDDGAGVKTRSQPDLPPDAKGVDYGKVAADLFVKGSTDTHAIDPNDVKQGYIGDCYFMAAIAAVARANPDALKKLIKTNSDGTYDVTLYVHDKWLSVDRKPTVIKKIKPTFPLDASGKPNYAGLGDKELWVMLLEKAYAKHKGGYDELDQGGDPEDAIEALGGKDADSYSLSSMSETEILDKIKLALKEKRPIVAASKKVDKNNKKTMEVVDKYHFVGNHAYSVQGVTGDKIELDNPWGRNDVTLPVSIFKKHFDDIDVAQK